MRISDNVCEAIDEFLFQRFGDKVYNLDVKLLHHGNTLQLITVSQSKKTEEIRTYELEIKLLDFYISSVKRTLVL